MRQGLTLAILAVAVPGQALALETPRDNIDALIEAQARANGVPASFIHRVVKRESGYNPRAVGRGGALGLMQIKHGTARALGYSGPASGLLDARVNLTYGVAYLAGAYKTARGNEAQAYSYYARGYYYAAKRAGIRTDVAELEPPPELPAQAPANPLNQFFGKIFAPTRTAAVATASADPSVAALSSAIPPQGAAAPAPAVETPPAAAPAQPAPPTMTHVPLPPERPAPVTALAFAAASPVSGLPVPTYGLRGGLAAAPQASAPTIQAAASAQAAAPAVTTVAAAAPAAAVEAEPERISIPLPPRRPPEFRHFVAKKPAPAAPMTASAAPETAPVSQ
ncbi:transglycosylase SLT domain-containing protein [Methylobacterium sp. ID0610]|uniref:transglycosylase SLT domain-containing protein n=1 Tax=Methylobacterium carpenticola TaxID=3344827 RepID=UPI0036BEE6D6